MKLLGHRNAAVLFVAFWTLAKFVATCAAASFIPDDLRMESQAEPSAVESRHPQFSWSLEPVDAAARGLVQTAYQTRLQSAEPSTSSPPAFIWDSGEIVSDREGHVEYLGPPLLAGMDYTWSVRVRDGAMKWTDWSAPAAFRMGLLRPEDWSAKWIGTGERGDPGIVDNSLEDPWFRREIDLDSAPRKAIAHVASVGFQEIYVNGARVGDAVLMPSVTDNSRRARYLTYDIAGLLHAGKNTLGIWMGTGWSIYPAFATTDKPRAPIVKAQFDLTMKDGSAVRVVTDSDWRTHPSPSRLLGSWFFHKFGGEFIDENLDVPNWSSPGSSERGWRPVTVFNPTLEVTAERSEPNRLMLPIAPESLTEPTPGIYRFDLGRNFSGWIEARLSGNPGDHIGIEISERPDQTMTFSLHDAYIIGPSGTGVFTNRFNYGAGRWVTIKGLHYRPAMDEVRGWLVRSAFDRASAFECSDQSLNKVYETALWTLENLSLGGYLVDCPHRERMGYGGDAHATTVTALMNYRTEAFFAKWAEDWRDVQYKSPDSLAARLMPVALSGPRQPGDLPYTAPTYWGGGGPSWSGYCVDLPWELYRHTGDIRTLEQSYPTMKSWLGFLEGKTSDGLLRRWGGDWDFLGDWLWPGAKGGDNDSRRTLFFNNCYWVYELSTAAKIAKLVREDAQASLWEARADAARAAINRSFYDRRVHRFEDATQASVAMALLAQVPSADERPAVWADLERLILVAHSGHIDAGITGGAMLFKVLSEAHRDDLIFAMVSQRDYPGWIDLESRGETTFGESWEGNDSLLHSSYLYVGAWFINGILGIQPGSDGRGFQHFTVWPGPVDRPSLSWAKGHYDSSCGRIVVAWKRLGATFELDVTIPANTTATLHLPIGRAGHATVDGQPIENADGIVSSSVGQGQATVTAGSGSYHFITDL